VVVVLAVVLVTDCPLVVDVTGNATAGPAVVVVELFGEMGAPR